MDGGPGRAAAGAGPRRAPGAGPSLGGFGTESLLARVSGPAVAIHDGTAGEERGERREEREERREKTGDELSGVGKSLPQIFE